LRIPGQSLPGDATSRLPQGVTEPCPFPSPALKVKEIKMLAKYFEPLQMHRAIFSNSSFFLLQHPDADSLYVEEIDVGEESM